MLPTPDKRVASSKVKLKTEKFKKNESKIQNLIILKVRKIRLLSPFKKNLETKNQQVGRGGG